MKTSKVFLNYVMLEWGCRHCGTVQFKKVEPRDGFCGKPVRRKDTDELKCCWCGEISKGQFTLNAARGKANRLSGYWNKFPKIKDAHVKKTLRSKKYKKRMEEKRQEYLLEKQEASRKKTVAINKRLEENNARTKRTKSNLDHKPVARSLKQVIQDKLRASKRSKHRKIKHESSRSGKTIKRNREKDNRN